MKLKNKSNLNPFLILTGLFLLYPLTGIYSITFFAIDLFEKLNLGSAVTVAIISALMRCLGTSLSSILIYKYGRRRIMMVSSVFITVTVGLIGGLVALDESKIGLDANLLSWILIALIFLFTFIAGVAIVNLPWVLMGESNSSHILLFVVIYLAFAATIIDSCKYAQHINVTDFR